MNESNVSSLSGTSGAQQPPHEAVSRRAQELWEKYGRPSGRDEQIWLEAERELMHSAPTPAPSAHPAATSQPASASQPAGESANSNGNMSRAPQRPSRAAATPRMPGGNRSSRSAAR